MIGLGFVNAIMGAMLAGVAIVNARDASHPRRWTNATFWGLWAVSFLVGSRLSDVANGILVLLMVVVASAGKVGAAPSSAEAPPAPTLGNRLFVPALTIPAVTLLGAWAFKQLTWRGAPLVDPKQITLVALAVGTLVALLVALVMLRPPLAAPVREARRLMDAVGWAAVLPQTLAALGAVFALAGVGQIVSSLAARWIPLGSPLVAVATYTLGMALFTMIMGNAFAAFPVMTAGIALPLIVQRFGGDVTIVSAIGMLSGFCGTLMTPMAANFNIVPAALLELRDEHAVVKAQIPTGALLLAANTLLMYLLAFRR